MSRHDLNSVDWVSKLKFVITVKLLKNWTPEKFAVITLKFEQGGFTMEKCVQEMQTESQTV